MKKVLIVPIFVFGFVAFANAQTQPSTSTTSTTAAPAKPNTPQLGESPASSGNSTTTGATNNTTPVGTKNSNRQTQGSGNIDSNKFPNSTAPKAKQQ